MERITSVKNPRIKELRKLKEKKERLVQGRFLAEGEKCAWEAMMAGWAECLICRENYPLEALAKEKGIEILFASRDVIQALSEAKHPQDALAVVRRPTWDAPPKPKGLFVALENISDPQNMGTILRTADAVGAAGAILSPESADPTGAKAVRAAMGSLFHVPLFQPNDFLGFLRQWKEQGMQFIAGHLKGESGEMPQNENQCILIGNEAKGLTEEAAGLADFLYKIKIYGRAESLNAAVAAGILLYRAKEGK